jgi:hypothetical protein
MVDSRAEVPLAYRKAPNTFEMIALPAAAGFCRFRWRGAHRSRDSENQSADNKMLSIVIHRAFRRIATVG